MHSNATSIVVTILKHRLRSLGHSLCRSREFYIVHHLPTLEPVGKGGEVDNAQHGIEKSCTGLDSVGHSRLPIWGIRDGAAQWLEMLSEMARIKGSGDTEANSTKRIFLVVSFLPKLLLPLLLI